MQLKNKLIQNVTYDIMTYKLSQLGKQRSEPIGDNRSCCECVINSTSSWHELHRRRYQHFDGASSWLVTI